MGQTEQVTARTNSLRLKLSPGMTDRLERLAETYGMPVSTLGAFAVADWVARQEMNASMTRMAVLEATRQGASAMLTESSMEAAFERALPQLMAELVKAGVGVPDGVELLSPKA